MGALHRQRVVWSAVAVLAAVVVACGQRVASDPDAGSGGSATGGALGGGSGGSATGGSTGGGTGGGSGGAIDSGTPDAGLDLDRDGLDDALEAQLAHDYLPVLAVHPSDGCPLDGLVYRARPHPTDATLVLIVYDHLYQDDCGLNGHVGDDEVFAITVNPAKPAPAGLTAIKAISHQGTFCQRSSECGTCNSLPACEGGDDAGRPTVFSSKDKHGNYVTSGSCGLFVTCLDECAMGNRQGVPLVNAGEPTAHLTEDLTDGGFITAVNGWTKPQLFHANPWSTGSFGNAGSIGGDLVDSAFVTAACR